MSGSFVKGLFLIFIFVLSVQSQALNVGATPDAKRTSGDLCDVKDPDFYDFRYEEQIAWCLRNVDTALKKRIYQLYNIPEKCQSNYTIDHFIPLALGGNNAVVNLWPEHKKVKATRHALEQQLYNQLNRAEISQDEAIRTIVKAKRHPAPEAYDIIDTCDR